ncbi:hypothetical protein CYMTET_35551 [Cymbomonas tetramitiformis]|uniref:CAAX prenyl protease 2/Lysostaphin resistance protein A-like domain-containing protein n=1 Tax=Cymbomonas tetramitiformis TaxID=36881 RepID=A0AAE0KNT3_9CHLO|nr:hypothetical protein CYMTET_35551 [Cymbomonas tetramitiformis]
MIINLLLSPINGNAIVLKSNQNFSSSTRSLPVQSYDNRECRKATRYAPITVVPKVACRRLLNRRASSTSPLFCFTDRDQTRNFQEAENRFDRPPSTSPGESDTNMEYDEVLVSREPKPEEGLWSVPWDAGVTTLVTSKFLVLAVGVGVLGLPILAQLRGLGDALPLAEKAFGIAGIQCLEGFLMLRMMEASLEPYRPLPAPWFRYSWDSAGVYLGAVAALGMAGIGGVAVTVLNDLQGLEEASANKEPIAELLAAGGPVALLVCLTVCVLTPLVEEYFWRGFLLPSLTRSMPVPQAVVLSGFMFALAHCQPHDLLMLTVLGTTLGTITVVAKGNLAVPTLAHVLWNTAILAAITWEQ